MVSVIQNVSQTRFCFFPALSSQAGRHPAQQKLGCEGQGEDSSHRHPEAGELLQAEESAAVTSQCSCGAASSCGRFPRSQNKEVILKRKTLLMSDTEAKAGLLGC